MGIKGDLLVSDLDKWIERRWARFRSSGCSLCWYHCNCKTYSRPPYEGKYKNGDIYER